MKNNLLFGFDVDFILSEIKKLSEEPLEAKEEILRGMIEHMPMNFSGCSAFMLKNTPEELELKKKLIIKLIQTHLPLVNPDHSDKTELKKMILTAVSTATYKEAEQILQKHHLLIEAGICPTKGDYDFYSCLACALAKKTPNALSTFKHLFNPKDVIGFQTLREIGLSLATLDGAGFKKDAKLLGFERNDKRHASALKQMIQLAIADDGDKNLEAFGKLAPQPNIEVLSIKQACNLVVLHAGDPAYNPMKYIDYVPKQEWESPEGLAAIDQLIADVAPKSINIAQALVSFFSKDPETHFKKGELPEKEDQDYLQMLKTALKLDPKKPADRQKLRECAMIVVKKYPKETLELAAHKLQLDVSDAEDLICFTHVFKEAAKTHAKLVFEIVNSYDSTFSTDAQRAAITEIFKEVVKQLGFDHFPFSATFWKMAKVQQALYKEVPPPFYKGIKLY